MTARWVVVFLTVWLLAFWAVVEHGRTIAQTVRTIHQSVTITDTGVSSLALPATGQLTFDGEGNDTYIVSDVADNLSVFTGGVEAIDIQSDQDIDFGGDIGVPAGTGVFLDTLAGTSYFRETNGDRISAWVGGNERVSIMSSGIGMVNITGQLYFDGIDQTGNDYIGNNIQDHIVIVAGGSQSFGVDPSGVAVASGGVIAYDSATNPSASTNYTQLSGGDVRTVVGGNPEFFVDAGGAAVNAAPDVFFFDGVGGNVRISGSSDQMLFNFGNPSQNLFTLNAAGSTLATDVDVTGIGGISEAGNAVPNATDGLDFFASTTSADLATVISDETGTDGGFARATSPDFTTPDINVATWDMLAYSGGGDIRMQVAALTDSSEVVLTDVSTTRPAVVLVVTTSATANSEGRSCMWVTRGTQNAVRLMVDESGWSNGQCGTTSGAGSMQVFYSAGGGDYRLRNTSNDTLTAYAFALIAD